MQIFHGSIITCDAGNTVASYLVEDKGRILFTGDRLPEKYWTKPLIELGPKALLPSFADTHLHYSSFALFAGTLDVRTAHCIEDIKSLIREYRIDSAPPFVLAFGASAHSVEEKRLLTLADLDDALSEIPVMVIKYDGHASIVNSRMLALFPDSIQSLRGFNAGSGQLFHEAYFAATDFITGKVSPLQLISGMVKGYDLMASRGFGLMHTVEGVGFPNDIDVTLANLLASGQRRGFRTRVWFQTMDAGKAVKRKLPRIGGCFATALDGCFGSGDAALNEPYSGGTNRGILFYDDATVTSFFRTAHRAGLQIAVHAIGDAAFDQACRCFDAVLTESPRADHRHTIIHACLPTASGLAVCSRQQIHIAAQSAFLDWPLEPLEYIESILGKRSDDILPLKTMVDLGIRVSLGSDAPCTVPDPIESLYCACNHYVAGQSVDVASALRMLTWNAAWAGFDEKETGSLEAGKCADMTILSENPLTVPPAALRRLKVERLYIAGKAWKPGQIFLSAIVRGLLSRVKI